MKIKIILYFVVISLLFTNVHSKERLILAPDCGLGHLPRNLAIKKLTTLVNAVKDL